MTAPGLIALDWGTTSLRAHRLGPAGRVLETRRSADGILSVPAGAFEATFRRVAGDWLGPDARVVASGMITSRQGWVETPYVPCPADGDRLAEAVTLHQLADGVEIAFAPGLRMPGGIRDVVRGEETQLLGLGRDGIAVHPGTHAKWARVAGGAIAAFVTVMTGELFAVLMAHSILGRLAEGRAHEPAAFARGVAAGADAAAAGALGHALFGGRTLALAEEIAPAGVASYVSGVLIGNEIAAAPALIGAGDAVPILFGDAALVARYAEAFAVLRRPVTLHTDDATVAGLAALARRIGWL